MKIGAVRVECLRARRRTVDIFAFFYYSKAAEALSVHAHAALHM